jgi:replicative DNA helicase
MNETEAFVVPTGISELDVVLGGGLEAEQLGLIVGGTGRGKSVFMAHLARHALMLNHSVVYYTLELSESVMARRFDSMFARVQPKELKIKNKEVFYKLQEMNNKHKESLIIKGFPTDGATTKTIRSHFRSLLSSGIKPRLIIVDYLDLLRSTRAYKDYRFELDNITKSLRGLSQEFNVPVWTASQLNRAGMAMETPDETSVAEALLKLFTVDVSIFMAQTKQEREDEKMRLFVGKNRNGPAGRTVEIDTDYSFLTFLRKPVQPLLVT